MTAKAISRHAKLKSFGEIGGSLSHTYRTRLTPNADLSRADLNENDFETPEQVIEAIKNRLPEKLRKDNVLCIEYLKTASPDWDGWGTEKEHQFFEESKQYLIEKYGADNVISTHIHRDETTPHLIAYIVPVDEKTGKLNAKKWLGGKEKLSKSQTDFANRVEYLGLERGLEGSKAEHVSIKKYYASVENTLNTPKINLDNLPEPGFFESKKDYAQRVVSELMPDYEKLVIEANKLDANKRELHVLREKVKDAKPYLDAIEYLPASSTNELDSIIKKESDRMRILYEKQKQQELEQYKELKDTYYDFEKYVNDCIAEKNNKHVDLDNRLSKTEKWLKKSKKTESEYESDKSSNFAISQDEPDFYIQQYQYEYFYQRAIKDHKDKIVKEVEEKNIESVVLKLKEQSDDAKLLKDIQTFDEYVMPIVTEFKLESKAEAEKRIAEQSENERRSSQRAENERIQREALEKYQNEKKLESGRYRAVPSNSNNDVDKKVDRDNDLSM